PLAVAIFAVVASPGLSQEHGRPVVGRDQGRTDRTDERWRENEGRPDERAPNAAEGVGRRTDLTEKRDTEVRSPDTILKEIKSAKEVEQVKTIDYVADHAYSEHGPEYNIHSPEEFKTIAQEHLEHPDDKTNLYKNECTAYWSERYKSILIVNHDKPA